MLTREAGADAGTPTCRKPSSKENVEELLGGNVGFEVSVEGAIVTRATAAGLFGRAEGCRLISVLVVLLPLLGVAQHGVGVADGCGEASRDTSDLCIEAAPRRAARAGTFERIRSSRSEVLVGVKLQSQLPVRLLQILLTGVFGNAQNFVKVLTVLNPAKTRRRNTFF